MMKLVILIALLVAAGYVVTQYFGHGGATMLGNAKAASEITDPQNATPPAP
jgi:hypothetical protein